MWVIQGQVSQHGEFDVGEHRLGGQFRGVASQAGERGQSPSWSAAATIRSQAILMCNRQAPPPADAHAGRSAPSPPAHTPPARLSGPGQRPPDPRPAESVHAAASSPTSHDACSISAPLPTHPAHPKLTPPCIASASNPPDPRTPSSPLL